MAVAMTQNFFAFWRSDRQLVADILINATGILDAVVIMAEVLDHVMSVFFSIYSANFTESALFLWSRMNEPFQSTPVMSGP